MCLYISQCVAILQRKLRYQQNLLTGKLTIGQKLCFAMGGLPYQMTGNCLGLFLPTFILEIAGVSNTIIVQTILAKIDYFLSKVEAKRFVYHIVMQQSVGRVHGSVDWLRGEQNRHKIRQSQALVSHIILSHSITRK